MRVIFFGTSEFAVPALKKLQESGYDIVAVVTRPDKPAGRKQLPLPSPVKLAALELKLKVLQPERLKIGNWKLEIPCADSYIIASYGQIIPSEIINLPKFGALNIHPSLLPKYRGPSPIQAAILNGDKETGVSIIKLDERLDHGPVIASAKLKVKSEKFKELHDKLAELGAKLLIDILPKYLAGKIKPVPQNDQRATFTKIIAKNDARIDWSKSAEEIDRAIRAYSHWPVAWTTLDGKRLKIFEAKISTAPPFRTLSRPGKGKGGVETGKIIINHALNVQTGTGPLEILFLQLEGGRRMNAKDFLNGFPGLKDKVLI